jgi:hypothetical protein
MAPAQAAPVERGLDALPVPESAVPDEYAGGGIVAFSNGGMSQMESDQAAMIDTLKRMGYSAADIATMIPRGIMGAFNAAVVRPTRAITGLDIPYAKDILAPEGSDFTSMTPFYDKLRGSKAPPLKDLPQSQPSYVDESKRGTASYGKDSGVAAQLRDLQLANAKRDAEASAERRAPTARETEGVNVKAADKAITDYAKKVRDLNKEFGVSDEPDAKARAALDKYKEKLNKDLDKAGALGLIQAGLGIAGGKSRYALQNLQGAIPAVEQYGKAMSQIREGEKGIIDSEAKLDQAADARARGNVKLALDLEQQAKELAVKERQAAAAERQAGRPTSTAELLTALQSPDPKVRAAAESILGRGKTGAVDERFLREQWAKMSTMEKMLLARDQKITSVEQYIAANLPGGAGGAGWGIRALPSGQ